MSLLILIRHGQGSFLSSDYDNLSKIGKKQALQLGNSWANWNIKIDRVFIGPRLRHRQTHDLVASIYQDRYLNWPKPVELIELDEFDAEALVKQSLPEIMEDPAIKAKIETLQSKNDQSLKVFRQLILHVGKKWVSGELKVKGVEPWKDFQDRIAYAIKTMTKSAGKRDNIVVFTSAGPIAAATGMALDCSPEKFLELCLTIRNGSFSEFFFTNKRFTMRSFNLIPDFSDPSLITYL